MSNRKLTYKPDSKHRSKHKWALSKPAIETDGDGKPVARCPESIQGDTAQRLLDNGLKWSGRRKRSPFPERVFNVHEGVPYRAQRLATGQYYGFPELPARIPPHIREKLRERAMKEGYGDVFNDWMTRYDGFR